MSEQWDGGKGDKSRISDLGSYRNNYDMIFHKEKNKETKSRFLFLDDTRNPSAAWLHDDATSLEKKSHISNHKWEVVRSYDAFVRWIDMNGIPIVVSFDHDLDSQAMLQFEDALSSGFIDYVKFQNKTGKHCAEYLVNKCFELGEPIPKYYVHSANHLARPVITKILEDAKRIIETNHDKK